MIIKPLKYELSLIYECPVCSTEYPFDISELVEGNLRWYCGCGQEFFIEKITNVQLGLGYNDKKEVVTEKEFINDAAKYLSAMGYKRDLINKAINRVDLNDPTKKICFNLGMWCQLLPGDNSLQIILTKVRRPRRSCCCSRHRRMRSKRLYPSR